YWQAKQVVAAALLRGEVQRPPVGRPERPALPIVDGSADFLAIAAIRSHQPNMCVFHRGLAIGEAAASSAIGYEFANGRPEGFVLAVLGRGQAMDAVVGQLQCEQVVVEELVLIQFAIRSEEELLAIR